MTKKKTDAELLAADQAWRCRQVCFEEIKMRDDLSAEFVRSVLDYNPETGEFRWKEKYWKGVLPGRIAGRINGKGYATISIQNKHYHAHRLAWLWMYGTWPNGQIDHINHNSADNSIANLRVVTGSENCRNRRRKQHYHTSKAKGVTFNKNCGKWQAAICLAGKRIKYLGTWEKEKDAAANYLAARLAEKIAEQCGIPFEP